MIRRSFLSLMAGAPLAGKAAAEHAVASLSGGAMPPAYPPPASGINECGSQNPTASIQRMDHRTALRMILNDAKAMEEIRAELTEAELRNGNPFIDADIQVMRSWSPMAKITFQRQRNVERALAQVLEDRPDEPNRYVRAFRNRMNKLVWGE